MEALHGRFYLYKDSLAYTAHIGTLGSITQQSLYELCKHLNSLRCIISFLHGYLPNPIISHAIMLLQPCLAAMHSCLLSIDNVDKRRLQASTANEEAIDISLLSQLIAVLLRHTAAVQDARLLGRLGGHFLGHPLADRLVDFLCLLGSGDFAGANGPVRC
jgi:hypothetical protein